MEPIRYVGSDPRVIVTRWMCLKCFDRSQVETEHNPSWRPNTGKSSRQIDEGLL